MFTRRKSFVVSSRPQVRSRRIAEAAELNKNKKLKIQQIAEIEPTKRTARAKKTAPVNVQSQQMKRKRKIEDAAPNKSKKLKTFQKVQEKQVKAYCWMCHKLGQDRICVCKRVYHNECLHKASLAFRYNKCPECQLKSANITDLSGPFTKGLKVYLESAIQLIRDKYKKKRLSWSQNTDDIGGINMKTLLKKVQDDAYRTTAEFFSDVKWLYHNSFLLYGEHSKKTKDMNIVIKDFKEELYDMEACPDCYYHLNCIKGNDADDAKYFVRLCNPPHDIVWARVPGHSYWPAKLLKVTNGKTRVRFFGKHEKADVAIHTIFHISESHPTHEHRNIRATETRTSLEYTYAKKELLDYITIYEENIGEFKNFGFRVFYVPINDSSTTCNEAQKVVNKVHHKKKPGEQNMISTNSSAFCRLLPLTSMPRVSSELYDTAISNSNSDVSVNMTFCVDTPSPGNNSSDARNYPSTNVVLPSSIVLPRLQSVESNTDRSTPSENSSFPSTSSNPTSNCMSPCSTTNLRDFQIKEESCDMGEPYCISSVDSCSTTTESMMQILHRALLNTANLSSSGGSSFSTRSCLDNIFQSCSEDNLGFPIVKKEILDCAPTTSGMAGAESLIYAIPSENLPTLTPTSRINESESNAISTENQVNANSSTENVPRQTENQVNAKSTENVPSLTPTSRMNETESESNAISTENIASLIPTRRISQNENQVDAISIEIQANAISTENQANAISTENVPNHLPTIVIHQTENKNNANSTENVSNLPSSGIDHAENVSNIKVQQSLQKVSLPSCNEITVIDLTGEDDHDNSDIRLSNVFVKNPQMKQLLEQTQKVVGNFITRVCEEVCYRQNPAPTQLCQTLTRKLNETEKKFQSETNKLRDEIKRLQKSLDAKT